MRRKGERQKCEGVLHTASQGLLSTPGALAGLVLLPFWAEACLLLVFSH